MELKGQHVLSAKQFSKEDLIELFKEARKMEKILEGDGICDCLNGKIMAALFFEPSTRTRFSFETAMLRLGGRVVSNFDMMNASSLKKGENLRDTGKVVSQIVDVIVMRHFEAGSAAKLASQSDVPVINAGDGANEHPTQALLDLYTIWKEKGKLSGLTIGIIGDLKYGRVPHSQCDLLKYFDVNFIFVSPRALSMPNEIVDDLNKNHRDVFATEDFEGVIDRMDVISMTRIQKERFSDEDEYKKYAGTYVLTGKLMKKAKKDAIIIHPLPRVDEISIEVDKDSRAKYFEQVRNGVAIRMALLKKILQ